MTTNDIQHNANTRKIVVCTLLSLAIFVVDSLIPLGVAGGVPYIAVILISLSPHTSNKLTVCAAIGVSFLTILGMFSSPAGGELWKVLANRSLALFAIWVTTILSIQRNLIYAEKEKTIEQIKVLSGFLPTCASCKKIKDENGYWNQIEQYIEKHSEANFSHEICPECTNQLYPTETTNCEQKNHQGKDKCLNPASVKVLSNQKDHCF